MAKKYYAVRQGRVPGVYATWADCEKQVKGFGGAIYKSFPTEAEARAFVEDSGLSLSDFIISLFCSGFTLPNTVYLSTALFISSLVLSVDASIYLSAFLIPAVFDISDTVTGLSPDITFISTP